MRSSFLLLLTILPACAVLHHVQVSDIDQRGNSKWYPINIKVSEMGVDIRQARNLVKGISTSKKGREAADTIAAIIGLFQQGPSTGRRVFSDRYAEDLILRLHEQCPSGKLTGLMSIREARKYPVISGEIIKITGYCKRKKK
ncbi:MAG: hypothetical protein AB8G05_24910 [Oligoflexales bacterium]